MFGRRKAAAEADPLASYDDEALLTISEIVRLTGANPRAVVRAGQELLLDVRDGRATVRSVREHRATLVDQEERITVRLPPREVRG